MRILLTKLKLIGDALLLTPTVRAIRAHYPDAEIVVVVRKGTEGILRGCTAIDRVLTAAAPEESRRSRWNWIEDLKLVLELRRKRFDFAIELGDGDRGRWLCALARAKVRGTNDHLTRLHGLWRKVFGRISKFEWGYRHRVEKDFFTVAHCLPIGDAPPGLCFERGRAVESWASREAGAGCIVFHPASRQAEKLWPEDRWIALGRALLSRECRIVISIGPAPEEVALGERIAAGIGPRAFSTQGKLSWPELARILHEARLFVGVDTAAMHLAAACQCPTVAIFGLASFLQWRPWQCPHRVMAGLPEMVELRAEAARLDNPILKVTVPAVLSAIGELEAECAPPRAAAATETIGGAGAACIPSDGGKQDG